MGRKHFIVLLGLLAHVNKVVGKNDFNPDFPTTYSFNATTPFSWLDIQGTTISSITVVGDSNQFERFELPLDPKRCVQTGIVNKVQTCTLWYNNGTATFGGSYAEKLVGGRLYHMVISWENEDAESEGASESPVFRMIDPLPATAGPGPPSSISSSIVSLKPSSSQPAVSPSNSGSISRSPTTSATVTIPTTSNPAAPPPTSTSASSPSPTPTQSPKVEKGLTPGAKAGITVGVFSLAVIVFLAIFFLHRRRQAKRKKPQVIQSVSRNTGIDLDDIAFTLGSPVTYDRVSEGRRGWHQRDPPPPPIQVPSALGKRAQSQQELHGSPF